MTTYLCLFTTKNVNNIPLALRVWSASITVRSSNKQNRNSTGNLFFFLPRIMHNQSSVFWLVADKMRIDSQTVSMSERFDFHRCQGGTSGVWCKLTALTALTASNVCTSDCLTFEYENRLNFIFVFFFFSGFVNKLRNKLHERNK